jgi:hypothetical protein
MLSSVIRLACRSSPSLRLQREGKSLSQHRPTLPCTQQRERSRIHHETKSFLPGDCFAVAPVCAQDARQLLGPLCRGEAGTTGPQGGRQGRLPLFVRAGSPVEKPGPASRTRRAGCPQSAASGWPSLWLLSLGQTRESDSGSGRRPKHAAGGTLAKNEQQAKSPPPHPQSRMPVPHRDGLLFSHVLLSKQENVTRPSGRRAKPANSDDLATGNNPATKQQTNTKPHPRH